MLTVTVLRGGTFGRCLGYEDGVIKNEINALIREAQKALLFFWPCEDPMRSKQSVTEPFSYHAGMLLLDFQPPEL